jgi:acetyl-CoA carboxylase biotin carboxyl carrier protein
VTTITFPKRDDPDGAAEPGAGVGDGAAITLAELREQTRALAEELPGTLRRITLRAGGLRVDVEWEGAPATYYAPAPYPAPGYPPAGYAGPVPGAPEAGGAAEPTAPAAATEAGPAAANTIPVTAPLVGTYYRASAPGAEPFVKIGDVVEPGQTLAIIEAMKLLNNISAEHRAKVVAIHVDNGDVVEYGQPLMDLEPVD